MSNIAKPFGLKKSDITAADTKTTPVDADSVTLIDSEASSIIKRLTWANLKTSIKSWLTGVSNTWAKSQISSVTSHNYAASITLNATDASLKHKITLTGDLTLSISNGTEGQALIVYLLQDGTGSHTVTFSGIDGTEPTVDTAANALTAVELEFVAGTGWRFV